MWNKIELNEIQKSKQEDIDFTKALSTPQKEREWLDLVESNNVPQGYAIGSDEFDTHFRLKERTMLGIFGIDNTGKALSIDTPIPTINGFKDMRDIKVGDIVFDENGNHCRVINATGIMYNRKCYKVSFSDYSSVIADEEHLWYVKKGSGFFVKTTKELIDSGLKYHRHQNKKYKEYSKYSIPVAKALDYDKDVDLPIDPYLVGVWLGDGTTDTSSISFSFNSLDANHFISEFEKIGLELYSKNYKSNRNTTTACIRKHKSDINKKTVIGLRELFKIKGKYIPNIYKNSSKEQKIRLVQGLLDTDGSCQKTGDIEFCSIHKHIAIDLSEILSSLGFKPYFFSKEMSISGRKLGRKAYYVIFRYDKDCGIDVISLKRKQKNIKSLSQKSKTRNSHVTIKSIEPVDSVPVKCIEVDSPNKLYVFGKNNLVTHNTSWYIFLACCYAKKYNLKFLLVCKENSSASMRQKIMELYLGKYIHQCSKEDIAKAKEFSYNHFDIVDNNIKINKDNIFDFLIHQYRNKHYFATFLDPYNAIQYDQSPKSNYQFLDDLRSFQNEFNTSFHISMHISTDKARNYVYGDKETITTFEGEIVAVRGQFKIPRKNFVEGGQPIANKLDDIMIVHRIQKMEELRNYTLISIDKVKEEQTGGMVSFENPIMFKKLYGYISFVDKNGINPLQNSEVRATSNQFPGQTPFDAFGEDITPEELPF